MREQLNRQRPRPSDPTPEASISLGSLWAGLRQDRVLLAFGKKRLLPGLGSAAASAGRRSRPARLSPASRDGFIPHCV